MKEETMKKEALGGAAGRAGKLLKGRGLFSRLKRTIKGKGASHLAQKKKLQTGMAQKGKLAMSSMEEQVAEKIAQAATEGRVFAQAAFFSEVEKVAEARGVDPSDIIKEAASTPMRKEVRKRWEETKGRQRTMDRAMPGKPFRAARKEHRRSEDRLEGAWGQQARKIRIRRRMEKNPRYSHWRQKAPWRKESSAEVEKLASADVETFEKLAYRGVEVCSSLGSGLGSFSHQVGSVGGANWCDQFKDSPLYGQALQLELQHKGLKAQESEIRSRHIQMDDQMWEQQRQMREQVEQAQKQESQPLEQQSAALEQQALQLETQLIQTKMGVSEQGAGLQPAAEVAPGQELQQQQGQETVQEQPGAVISGQNGAPVNFQTNQAGGEFPTQ
jgi:hypothetical protein